MLKKIATFLAAATLMLSMSAPAMAAFDDFSLIRIIYDNAGHEVFTDLGNINTVLGNPATMASTSFVVGGTAGTAGSLFGSTSFANLNVAYLAFDTNNPSGTTWFSGNSVPTSIDNGTFYNQIGNFQGYLKSLSFTNGNAIGSAANLNSYASLLQGAGSGLLGGMVDKSIEANLAALASGGSITQKLYYFADNSSGTAQLQSLTLYTNANGTTTNEAPTPIPPSLLLMGSGLLGMVGIRRKLAA